MPTPLDEMMGMASSDEMNTLYKSRGTEADKIFATLMIAHHKGGLHMAEYAKANAKNKEAIAFADSIHSVAGIRNLRVEESTLSTQLSKPLWRGWCRHCRCC